ncbi:MAG: tRNA (5-methylaminomethyl-2-thiouridine)(34)-methyltransferase MnmD [Pseudomonadota bacterium]
MARQTPEEPMARSVVPSLKAHADNGSVDVSGHVALVPGEPPFSARFDDHYFSRHDGLAESRHVFLAGNHLSQRWANMDHDAVFHLAELGFGTGLNCLAAWELWRQVRPQNARLMITSFEGFPVSAFEAQSVHAVWPDLAELSQPLIDRWDRLQDGVSLDQQTQLQVRFGAVSDTVTRLKTPQDAWFLDGFSPAKNPEMWSADLMQDVARATAASGTFASYTAAGWVRRNLEKAGFSVQKVPGFGTKREMISGRVCPSDGGVEA